MGALNIKVWESGASVICFNISSRRHVGPQWPFIGRGVHKGGWGKVGQGGTGPIDFQMDLKSFRNRETKIINNAFDKDEKGNLVFTPDGSFFREERVRIHICDQDGSPFIKTLKYLKALKYCLYSLHTYAGYKVFELLWRIGFHGPAYSR